MISNERETERRNVILLCTTLILEVATTVVTSLNFQTPIFPGGFALVFSNEWQSQLLVKSDDWGLHLSIWLSLIAFLLAVGSDQGRSVRKSVGGSVAAGGIAGLFVSWSVNRVLGHSVWLLSTTVAYCLLTVQLCALYQVRKFAFSLHEKRTPSVTENTYSDKFALMIV